MSLASLPNEVLDLIITNLDQHNLAAYATISHDWTSVIEARTFRIIHITSGIRLNQISKVIVDERRALLRRLHFTILLPTYPKRRRCKYETLQENEANSAILTDDLYQLFWMLSKWGNIGDGVTDTGFELFLKVHSPSDIISSGDTIRARRGVPNEADLFTRRYENSHLYLIDSLPLVACIREFRFQNHLTHHFIPRFLAGSALISITASLPNLVSITGSVGDDEKRDIERRKGERNDFAASLANLPKSLKSFDISFYHHPPHDQRSDSPCLCRASTTDPLNGQLHAVSQKLTAIFLDNITLDPRFFWPQVVSLSTPHWPEFRQNHISCSPETLAGQWLINGRPEYADDPDPDDLRYWDDEDEDDHLGLPRSEWRDYKFRDMPYQTLLDTLYIAIGKAVGRMPKLEKMYFSLWGDQIRDDIRSGNQELELVIEQRRGTAVWYCETVYEPSQAVLDQWKESFSQRGEELSIEVICERRE